MWPWIVARTFLSSITAWCARPHRAPLASGVADALAKWYEASVSSGDSSDGLVQQAVQMARVLRDQLLIDSLSGAGGPRQCCLGAHC